MAEALGVKAGGPLAAGTRAMAGSQTANAFYGDRDDTSLFAPCVDDTLVNASIGPVGSINEWLMWRETNVELRQFPLLTAIGEPESYSEPTGPCEDCPHPEFSACSIAYNLGTICRETPEYDVRAQGMRLCDAQPIYRLFGSVGNAAMGTVIDRDDEWGAVQAAVMTQQRMAELAWIGNPALGSAGAEQPKGLQILVNTGYVDADTGAVCPAVDSDVKDYGSNCIGDSGSPSIAAYIIRLVRQARYRARMAGIGSPSPADFAIWAHPLLVDALFDNWPCEDIGCLANAANPASLQMNINVTDMRDQYRARGALPVDGSFIPVHDDPFMPVTYSGTDRSVVGDVFVLLRSIAGRPVLWGEYQNFNGSIAGLPAYMRRNGSSDFQTSDGGRFIWNFERQSYCFKGRMSARWRYITIAPFLQGRIENVCARFLQAYPEPQPGDQYGLSGGVSYGTDRAPTYKPAYYYYDGSIQQFGTAQDSH